MTEKQKNILEAALQLFARDGYAATSTSKVAKAAGVSEGLIFRHFTNKEGLLNAILEEAHHKAREKYADVVLTTDPKECIRKVLEMPFRFEQAHYEPWRLIYAIKWQTQNYDGSALDPIRMALKNAFEKLNYQDPEAETELVLMFLDGAATALLLHEPNNKMEVLEVLKQKYDL